MRACHTAANIKFPAASGADRAWREDEPGSARCRPGGVPNRADSATVGQDLGRGGVTPSPALVSVVRRPRRAELAVVRSRARRALITAQEVAWT
jgi:hypothetical protein